MFGQSRLLLAGTQPTPSLAPRGSGLRPRRSTGVTRRTPGRRPSRVSPGAAWLEALPADMAELPQAPAWARPRGPWGPWGWSAGPTVPPSPHLVLLSVTPSLSTFRTMFPGGFPSALGPETRQLLPSQTNVGFLCAMAPVGWLAPRCLHLVGTPLLRIVLPGCAPLVGQLPAGRTRSASPGGSGQIRSGPGVLLRPCRGGAWCGSCGAGGGCSPRLIIVNYCIVFRENS